MAAFPNRSSTSDEEVLIGHARVAVGLPVGQQVDDAVVAEAPPAPPLPDAGLLDGVGDAGACRPVDPPDVPAARAGRQAGAGVDDAPYGGPPRGQRLAGFGVAAKHPVAAGG